MKHAQYFGGKVQSLELFTAAGERATVGVIEPGNFTFSTNSEEHIVLVEGTMNVRLPDAGWRTFVKGEELVVAPNASFDIQAQGHVAYICYYR